MLKIEKTVTASPEQFEIVVEGMRNAMNSWPDMDSSIEYIEDPETLNRAAWQFHLGEKDEKLMLKLNKGGDSEAKYRRMIPVHFTIIAPLYWWKQFDTYKVGTVCNSCSTMHKIHDKEFEVSDFSWECTDNSYWTVEAKAHILDALNEARRQYLAAKEAKEMNTARMYWDTMIKLLPDSYNQKRTINLNYQVLHKIYNERRHHKLGEWHIFCDWIETLPYSYLITGKVEEKQSFANPIVEMGGAAAVMSKAVEATYKDLQKATRELY